MIKVFNGNWRGIGEQDKGIGMILDFKFRTIIHHFKGANLHIFLAICLHADDSGFCYPSYDTLERETGYKRATVAKAINELCETVIDGQYVLMRWRERNEQGQFTGSNRYRIFPTRDEIREIDPEFIFSNSGQNPTLDKPNSGQSELEDKPVVKDKPEERERAATKHPFLNGDPPTQPKPASLSPRGGLHERNGIDPRKIKNGTIRAGQGETAAEVYREVFDYTPSRSQLRTMNREVDNLEKWRNVCRSWSLAGFRPNNFKGMLDWYREGIPSYANVAANGNGQTSALSTFMGSER